MSSSRPSGHDERGLSESLQWAALTPLLMLMVLGSIQAGIVLHGRTVARNAALAGAQAQAIAGGTGAGEQVARDIALRGGLQDVSVTVDMGGDARVSVDGRVNSFLDIGVGRVHSVAVTPLEGPR